MDIFFVISGFLISSILFRSLLRNDFSFAEFYAHRVKRIFPALILILAVSFVLGWFILLPDEYMRLGKHIAAGAGFVQNFVLWKESGYFDIDSQMKPLLHLWSLSVEEQFYLIYPFLIWAAWRLKHNVLVIVSLLALLSFGLNVQMVGHDATAAFFLPYTRFWELMAGAELAYLQAFRRDQLAKWITGSHLHPFSTNPETMDSWRGTNIRNLFSFGGLLLILAAIIGLHKSDQFPGWWALLPVLGAVLMILSGPDAWPNRKILSSRLMIFVGLISYPLYLWHWPLLSFVYILDSGAPSLEMRAAIILLSLLLAWLTYRFLEKPIRFGRKTWIKTFALSFLTVVIGYIGYNDYSRVGLEFRHVPTIDPKQFGTVAGNKRYITKGCGIQDAKEAALFAFCISDKRGKPRFALIGDSKAEALFPGVFMESSPKERWLFIGGTDKQGTVFPVISDAPIYSWYQSRARAAVKAIAENPDIRVVVITTATRNLFQLKNDSSIDDLPSSKNFDVAFNGLDNTVAEFVRAGKKVVLTVDNPTFKDPKLSMPRTLGSPYLDKLMGLKREFRPFSISYDRHMELTRQYRALLNKVQAKYPAQVRIFDPLDQLCDMKKRVCSSMLNGKLLYSYSDHISDFASVRIAKKLDPFVERFARGE